jgi:hypothetical protein
LAATRRLQPTSRQKTACNVRPKRRQLWAMSIIKPDRRALENATALAMAKTLALEGPYSAQPSDSKLKLGPLASRRTLDSKVTVEANRREAQVTVESVGSNGVKHITNILLSASYTQRARQSILTVHTQMFASMRDTIPALTDVRTTIVEHIEVTPKLHEFFTTVVDKDGVHRFPVERAEILF